MKKLLFQLKKMVYNTKQRFNLLVVIGRRILDNPGYLQQKGYIDEHWAIQTIDLGRDDVLMSAHFYGVRYYYTRRKYENVQIAS